MWRLGASLLVLALVTEISAADGENRKDIDRQKRSPYPPYWPPPPPYPPPPPPYPPPFPPPPPPFWPPPPPPHYYVYDNYRQPGEAHASAAAQAQASSNANQQTEQIRQEHLSEQHLEQPAQGQASESHGESAANQVAPEENAGQPSGPRCDTGSNKSSSVSNAQSEYGDAIAVAIARAKAQH